MKVYHKSFIVSFLGAALIMFSIHLIFFLLTKSTIGCFFEKMTTYPCPTCGLTSAWYQFLHGNIKLAFYYHPLFLLIPFTGIYMIKNLGINQYPSKYFVKVFIFIVLLFLIVYVFRMIFIPESIV